MKIMKKILSAVLALSAALMMTGKVWATPLTPEELSQVSQMVEYLQQTYGIQLVAAGSSAEIVCQSGGTCAVPDGAGHFINCTCGGGSTCPSNKSCKCTCNQHDGQLDCAYDCVAKPPASTTPANP